MSAKQEGFPGFLPIAVPVALSYLGIMLLGVVDLMLVGKLGPVAQGAVGIGTSVFTWFLVFGIGLLSSMDYFVSIALGADRPRDAARSLTQGLILGTALGLPLTALLVWISEHLEWMGIHPEVAPHAAAYLRVLSVSLWPVYVFAAARSYLQALHRAWEGFAILVAANLINYWLNLKLIDSMGVTGSAWATVLSRFLMAIAMLWATLRLAKIQSSDWRPELRHQMELVRLGLPAGLQSTAEAGVFALSTILAGRLDPLSLAAHQIVLNLASMTFIVPLGIGTAAAVCVGFFLGRNDRRAAAVQGWTALGWTLAFMACTGVLFGTLGQRLLGVYTSDPSVLALAWKVLVIAAFFQLSDGTQTVLTGALRGWGDTHSAFYANVAGHWLVGLPLGLLLGFTFHKGIFGIWLGLATGLTLVAAALLWTWYRRAKSAAPEPHRAGLCWKG